MSTSPKKRKFPLDQARRHLEPGPIVLVSSRWKGHANIMVMGWHMMLGFSPALFGCYIWEGNHSYAMLRQSRECVINIPTLDMLDAVVGIGNSSASSGIDKFHAFGLTPEPALAVKAPLIRECYASFECRLVDDRQIDAYGLFIWEIVQAHVAATPTHPQTLHYRGEGEFMVPGNYVNRRPDFKPQNL
jgi:flavin reductase (DIM6/NTAB) family NADH-FMN oxidoreductase RutF